MLNCPEQTSHITTKIHCYYTSDNQEDALSPEELRKRLYQTFKNKGVLDTLKVQLRNQLIQELKSPHSKGQNPALRPLPGASDTLLLSACNTIVADHLRTLGYEYTLSIFCPESGVCKDEILKKENLLQILKFSPSTAFFTSMLNKEDGDKGLLFSLLTNLTHHSAHNLRNDVDTQTTNLASYGESLVDKMKMIDRQYENSSLGEDKMFPLQSKLAAYKKEIEAQKEAEMNTKLKHFKDVEIAKVRMDEKAKFNQELEKLKQELERTYEMRAKALMDREKNAIERLQKQQEIEEKNVYMQRQLLLKEIETLRSRENELRMRTEAFEKSCEIHAEKMRATEELLRRRELAVKTMEDTYDQRLKNELSSYQLELKEEFLRRTEKLTESENRNKVETARIQKESDLIESRLEEHNRACIELKKLQVELETAQQQISLLTQQKELLKERLESTSDYSRLKLEKTELLGQLQLLKKQLEEAQGENQRLRAEMIKPSKEELALQTELHRLQNARTLDEAEFENQKQVLQTQLQCEVERCAQLKAQLTECEERAEWMTKHVEEIKTQLHQTQQALENEVLRNPKPSLVDRSVLEFSADSLVPPDIYVDRAMLRSRVSHHDVFEAGEPLRRHKFPWSDSPDSDMELVAEAKARIQKLQKEAESLEEAYRNYQQRAVPPIASHRPLSPQQTYFSHYPSSSLRKKDSLPSHNYSTHRPKTLLKQLTPQCIQSPALVSHDTGNIMPPSEVYDQPQAPFVPEQSRHSLSEPVFVRDGQSQDESSASVKQSSGTAQSCSRKRHQKQNAEEPAVSAMALSQPPLSDTRLFCASVVTVANTGDFSPELSPPHSPQLRSTARDHSSPPKAQPVFSSLESSPHPEEINLEDLTGDLQEPGHIPELLLDTAVPFSEEAPEGPATPQPQDLPEDPADSHSQPDVQETSGDSVKKEEEEEEQRWERERKEKQEQRHRELEETKELELQELERLEKETVTLLEEAVQTEKEGEETEEEADIKKGEDDEQSREEPKVENPLEKYMKMVLEAREKQNEQKPVREEGGQMSPEDKSLFEEKDESIAAFSLKDEEDEFW
ncbi:centriole and centriolar satellite protein ofd1 isoform X3 [Xiphophorus couchianus]|uniref:centriole and centriolar satellite protein ofd1 isoform X3 n=1 Tax=Xiphophorus couchianus TaxID=32473 RepID=UPI001016D4FB|nr:oral-facial-digital syndrome 1 protein isoform X3 [Xiphophorus couchianus]